MPTKSKPADKTPKRPLRTELTISLPTAVLDDVDALAMKAGFSRADTIEKILTACSFSASAPDPKPPRPCERKAEICDDEVLLPKALEVIRLSRRASTTMLQRRLRIGYTQAARLMDLLEKRGIVGPQVGSNTRKILVDLNNEILGHPDHVAGGVAER